MCVLSLTDLQRLLQDVLVADHAHVRIVRFNLLGLVHGHLLDHVSEKLDCLIWGEHLRADGLLLAWSPTGFQAPATHSHTCSSIKRALHELATLGRELLTAHLDVSQVCIDFAAVAHSE